MIFLFMMNHGHVSAKLFLSFEYLGFQSQSFLKEYKKPDVMLQLRLAKVGGVIAFFFYFTLGLKHSD